MLDPKTKLKLLKKSISERLTDIERFDHRSVTLSREGTPPVETAQRYRSIQSGMVNRVLMFGSNNYLNLNTHPSVVQAVARSIEENGIGTGGSPGFSGYSSAHISLERKLARTASHEDSILLPCGFMANLCWVNGLFGKQDTIFVDQNSHASVFEGLASSPAKSVIFDPEDIESFESKIQVELANGAASSFMAATFEGVRSSDGTISKLEDLVYICKKYNLFIILDDAHGFGVIGKGGKGSIEHASINPQDIDLRMSTCSKALGCQGAFLSGSSSAINFLRKTSIPYLFTTSLSYSSIAAISSALDVIDSEPERISKLQSNIHYLTQSIKSSGFQTIENESGIVPLYIENGLARELCLQLHENGLFVNLMEFPIISRNSTEYLRFSTMSDHSCNEIDHAMDILKSSLDCM